LKQVQEAGEISPQWDAHELAKYCLNSWDGALLQKKISKSVIPLKVFMRLTFGFVLNAGSNSG